MLKELLTVLDTSVKLNCTIQDNINQICGVDSERYDWETLSKLTNDAQDEIAALHTVMVKHFDEVEKVKRRYELVCGFVFGLKLDEDQNNNWDTLVNHMADNINAVLLQT